MPPSPIARFRRWYAEAERAGAPLPEAVALATADARGRPSVRYVLLKHADVRGFVFFTDGRSRKGRELEANPEAALACYWDALGRQVRVEGRVVVVDGPEADAYWATRPRESRLAASASTQSAPLASRAALVRRWRALGRRHPGDDVPRPPLWRGYRLAPRAIEFWTRGESRLHRRERFERRRGGWRRRLLQP
ncbi:MAG: pyridoxamine 5'-phosphate oxidase [Deltaproteobacteria bacterium]|nr:pyridoxamine 5'-phosphate oxidase [Deltaproteobacteria bacterium]